jgi:hypothetical protein
MPRHFDILRKIRVQIKAVVVLLGRGSRIAVQTHDIRDVSRISYNLPYKLSLTAPFRLL